MLIINADDFGKDSLTNRAIIQSFKKSLCSSTTLMPNMPGFKEACQLAHDNKLTDHIGIHMVISEGHPLTENIKHCSRLCNSKGLLCFSRNERTFFYLTSSEKRAIADEIREQIRRCREFGVKITHLDSHSHVHTEWALFQIVVKIVREEKIPYIRISRNCGSGISFYKRIYKYLFNRKLKNTFLARTQYFGSLEDYLYLKQLLRSSITSKPFEIMIHPTLDPRGNLIDADSVDNKTLEDEMREVDIYREAMSFKGKGIYRPRSG